MKIFVTGAGTSAKLSSSMPFGRATLLRDWRATRNRRQRFRVSGPLQFQETCSRLVCWPLQLRVRTRSCIWRTFMTSASITPS